MNILCISLLALLAQSGMIQGVVVKDSNGGPLNKARVELHAGASESTIVDTVTTDDDGGFFFRGLRPGRYRVVVTRAGYVRAPVAVTVADGTPSVLRLPMRATGVIYGRVTDAKGEGLGNIEVEALKASYTGGVRRLTLVRSVQTNDAGEYRLFWLPPGRYYIVAIHPDSLDPVTRMFRGGAFGMTLAEGISGSFFSNANTDPALELTREIDRPGERQAKAERFMPVYYPGTIDEQAASAINVKSGQDVGGINIAIAPVRARHVRGVIVDGATGRPAQYASITLTDRPERLGNDESAVDRDTGAFDLLLLPGVHVVTANAVSGEGQVELHVGDVDIDNLTIPTAFLFKVRSRISVEGQGVSPTDLENVRISLRRDPPPRATPRAAQASYSIPLTDGHFSLEGAAGNFRVSVAPILNLGLPTFPVSLPRSLQNAYVKSIRLGNNDVLNDGLHLEREPDGLLEIVIALRPGIVSGTVSDEARRPAGDATVVLVPDNRKRTDLYFSTVADPSGRFRIDHVPPGNYRIFAWSEIETGDWFDAELIRGYDSRGIPVQVTEGTEREVQTLLIP